jgi:xanthosine utilization system XapX-like protein
MSKFGPDRGELRFRLVFSLVGLALLGVAVAIRGIPSGPALVEVFGIAGLFFGGTAVWTIWKLTKGGKDGL